MENIVVARQLACLHCSYCLDVNLQSEAKAMIINKLMAVVLIK